MRLSLKTAATGIALDWADIKGHLRLDTEDERARIEGLLVPAAQEWIESLTNRELLTTTWTGYRDTFPADGSPIVLPRPPLQSVTSVKYLDTAGVLQTWAATNYSVDAPAGPKAAPGRIIPGPSVSYPTTYGQPNDVQIEFIAGYGASAAVPASLKAALLLLVGDQFEQREESISGTIITRVPTSAVSLALGFLVEVS